MTSRAPGRRELTALLAFSIALAALGIDVMLPALGAIRAELGLGEQSTAVAGLVTAYFIGMAAGQVGYGPLADRYGRRSALYLGFALYGVGALAAAVSPSLPLLLVSRFVWGLGAGGPRVAVLAIVRDMYEGERMARIMSFVFAVFILVPVVAPTIGAAGVRAASWRWLFAGCAVAVVLMAVWALRLPETLRDEYRVELRLRRVIAAAKAVVSNRQTVAYTLATTALYGAFTSYLGSSEIIIGETYGRAAEFPLIFGGVAACMGAAMLANARAVERVGTRRLAHGTLTAYVVVAAAIAVVAVVSGGRPPLPVYVAEVVLMLAGHALLLPNLNTIAMDPMAAIAGTASSVIGAVQTAAGALLGSVIDAAYDGTVRALSFGFLVCGFAALMLVLWGESGRLFRPREIQHDVQPAAAEIT
jgi:DHA1 family bicyclomycin/chloramphenicol resistance-like MFS transporter